MTAITALARNGRNDGCLEVGMKVNTRGTTEKEGVEAAIDASARGLPSRWLNNT